MTFSVSQSKIRSWRTCHFQYYCAHILNLMRRKKARPLMRGTMIHDMIEDKIEKRDPWARYEKWLKKSKKLFQEEEYEDLPLEIKRLMEGYFAHYKRDPYKPVKNDGRHCEYPFEVPLIRGITLKGRIDGYARHKIDRTDWLVERKSHKQIPTSEFKFTDIQSGLYTWVAPQIGFPEPDGVLWDYVRAKVPTKPQLLKSGVLSKAANIDTLWPVYLEAIKENDLKVSDYSDMKKLLITSSNRFFSRVTMPISKIFQKNLVADTITTAKEMRRHAGKDKTRNVGKHCAWCAFQPLCQAELMGLDTKFIMKAEYTESDYGK